MNNIDESIKNRIVVDFEEINKDIHAVLDEFIQFKIDKKMKAAVGTEYIEKISDWEMNIKRRLEDDFSIVIIGDFKRGRNSSKKHKRYYRIMNIYFNIYKHYVYKNSVGDIYESTNRSSSKRSRGNNGNFKSVGKGRQDSI